jgi:hypothetical protein
MLTLPRFVFSLVVGCLEICRAIPSFDTVFSMAPNSWRDSLYCQQPEIHSVAS